MAKIIMIRNTFGGCSYLQKALNYTRDPRAVGGGAYGVDMVDPAVAYQQMMYTKQYFNKTSGNPLIHLIVSYSKKVNSCELANTYSWNIARYYADRYQVFFCTHMMDDNDWYHMHMIVNSVSYINGAMFDSSFNEMKKFCNHVQDITGEKYQFYYNNKNNAQ